MLLLAVASLCLSCSAPAELPAERSVKPGINERFLNPDLDVDWALGVFEGESREINVHRQAIAEQLQLQPSMAIADVGAGTGLFLELFASAVGPNGKVYAVDIAKNFIDHIERMAKAEKRGNITGIVCTQQSTKLPPNSVDLVFICDTYHHFEFPQKTMRSIHKALKPGGRVVLIDFHRIEGKSSKWVLGHVRAGQETFTQEIVQAGFKKVGMEKGLLKENYFVRFAKVGK